MPHVITKFERTDAEEVAALAEFGSATIHEAQGRLGALSSRLKPIDRAMSLCGPAYTVECAPRDNIMLQLAIHFAQPGDVIVVSAGEYEEVGSFGDVLGNACLAKGIAGVVTDTGVRDTAELIKLGLPVFSLSVCIKGTVKETLGQLGGTIIVGGQEIRSGDIIRGDPTGWSWCAAKMPPQWPRNPPTAKRPKPSISKPINPGARSLTFAILTGC